MYNGIGLQTARGSGTNGYVQTNRFLVKPRLNKVVTDPSNKPFEGTAGLSGKANKEILEHDRKRQIQLKLLVLEEKLMDQGYTDDEIAQKMEEKRRDLEAEAAVNALEDGEVGPMSVTNSKISDTQTHQIAARKERQMETMRAALGIGVEIPNKRYALLPSDAEDSDKEDEPANGRKKDNNSKKNLKGVVDNTSDLRDVKKSRGNESAEDTTNESSRHKKQKSGRGRRDDSSDSDDSDEKVVKRSKKRTHRKTSSDSDDKDADAKKKKNISRKSRSSRRRHDSDSSDSGSDTDSSSDSDGGRGHGRSLKKAEYHKRDAKEAAKKPRKTLSSSESDQSDDDKKKKISSKRDVKEAAKKPRRTSSSSESDQSDVDRKKKLPSKRYSRSRRHDSVSSSSESDLNDRRRTGKEKAHGDDEKAQLERDSDGLDTLRNLEKLYQSKEERMVKLDRVGKEPNINKRKMDEGYWDEQPDRKSKRRDTRDLEYNDEVKHSLGSKPRSENQISDRWGVEPSRDYDVTRRESREDRERQGRKHRRDEEEDTPRISDREQQDDRKSNKYERERDYDTSKRARYEDSRSGRRYDEDDDRQGRKHSDGRHDDRRSTYDEDDDRHGRKHSDGRHDDRRSRR